ncbi:hypothetical protein ACQP2F_11970 [Actinoplanes sp. CA-030573]|uniref:hypothetical protein n=1 Tax=Actinoplanes sp. CA-030573 TaxID=3239898 RepID=UPI003D926AAC
MILRLVVTDGTQSPAVAESVEVAADGAISGWRSVSEGGVGWFAGRLPAGELAAIQALAGAVTAAPPAEPPPPGSGQQVLELPATGPVPIAAIADGPGEWPALAAAARRLLDRLTAFPRAAVAVTPDGRLVHRGTEPLRLDLSTIAVRVTAWRGYYEPASDWDNVVEGPSEVEAGPGWAYDLPFDLEVQAGVTLHLTADFAVLSGTTRILVRAKHTPAIDPAGN